MPTCVHKLSLYSKNYMRHEYLQGWGLTPNLKRSTVSVVFLAADYKKSEKNLAKNARSNGEHVVIYSIPETLF